MMVWGDEFGRTVNGNNNSYNIDSSATWNNYNMIGTNSPDTVATGDTTGGTMGYANNLGTFAGAGNGNFAFLQYLLHLRAVMPHSASRITTSPLLSAATPTSSSGFDDEWSNPSAMITIFGEPGGRRRLRRYEPIFPAHPSLTRCPPGHPALIGCE